MSGGSSYQIAHLLEKMTSNDKDFRFMALNDLMSELQKDSIKLDDDSERKVVRMVLRLLEDKNGEVQNLAVRCLGPLVSKVKDYQVELIVDTLCNNMVGDSEQLRDISSIALKTVIHELPLPKYPKPYHFSIQNASLASRYPSLASSVCRTIVGRLSTAISRQNDVSVQLEALDILSDLLSRFGSVLMPFHSTLLDSLLPQLQSQRLAVRKRSIIAIGHLVMCCDQTLYGRLIDHLLKVLNDDHSMSDYSNARTYIQALGAICRMAGHRFAMHVPKVVPLVQKFAKIEDDEMREHCLQLLESMVLKCSKEMSEHTGSITKMCLNFICYDPNYNYDDNDENDAEQDDAMELDEDDEDESDDEYSDDDDMSWKVRRGAAKCLEALIATTRRELVVELYDRVSPALINRFKEREENVKADIFNAYIALIKKTRSVSSTTSPDNNSPLKSLERQTSDLVRSLHKHMKEKSVKTRQGCFQLLSELLEVLPAALNDHVSSLIPGIVFSLSEKQSSSNMRIDTLAFIRVLLNRNPNKSTFQPHCNVIVPIVIVAVADHFYKIASEALAVVETLVTVIRPLDEAQRIIGELSDQAKMHVQQLYSCCYGRLSSSDVDHEVKERAISCMGRIIEHMGDCLQPQLRNCLPLLNERLKNEITRLTAVNAIIRIAKSKLNIDLGLILQDIVPTLSSFLRKNHRSLKVSSLVLLESLVSQYASHLAASKPSLLDSILQEVPALISDSDLHIAQLSLLLLTSCINHLGAESIIVDFVVHQTHPGGQVFSIVQSPLLQGAALLALLDFFRAVVSNGILKADVLVNMYLDTIMKADKSNIMNKGNSSNGNINKSGFASVAKVVAAVAVTQKPEIIHRTVLNVSAYLKDSTRDSNDQRRPIVFALLTVGEIGKSVDLSSMGDLRSCVSQCFEHNQEEVKSAASYAMGNMSLGNLNIFLPSILNDIEKQPRRQYLLLHALKEIISVRSASSDGSRELAPFADDIWNQLFKHCECPEEGTRNVVAECLGRLCFIAPEKLIRQLKTALDSNSPYMRATVVTAIKFTITDQPHDGMDTHLKSQIGDFLQTLHDNDLNVRRVALVLFNSAAHNKPSLIKDLLPSVLPQLYRETQKRKELIREVEMGPFKHEVDDGLDLRKAAFECMYTQLETCVDRIDMLEFLTHVQDGLKDHYDIKMLTYLMVARVSQVCPVAVLARLDRLVEPLKATVSTKVKANAVKQEFEKQDELKRSAMRAVLALMSVPGADKHPQMNDFLTQIKNTPDLNSLFESVQKDASSGVASSFYNTKVNNDAMDIS